MVSLLVASSQSTISNAFIQNVVTVSQATAANTNGTLFFLRNVKSITTTKTVGELGISGRTISALVSSDGTTGLNAIVRPGTTFSVSGSVNVENTGLGTTPTANTYMVTGEPYTDSDVSISYPLPPFISNSSNTSNHITVSTASAVLGPGNVTYGGTFTHSGYYEVAGYISETTFTATYVAANFGIMSGHVLTTRDLTVTTNDHIPITGTQIVSQLTGQLSGTGTISGFTLTLSAAVTGLVVGATITGAGVLPYTTIVAGVSVTSWTVSRSHSISSTTTFSFGGLTGTYSVSKSQTIGSSGSTKTFRIGGTYGLTFPMGIFTEDLPIYVTGQGGAGNIGGGAYVYAAGNSTLSSFGSYSTGISTQLNPRTSHTVGALYYFCPTVWIPFVCNHASGNGPVQATPTLYLLDTRTNSITFNQGVSFSASNKKPTAGFALKNNVKQLDLPNFFYNKITQYVVTSSQKYKQTFSNQTRLKAKKSVESAKIIAMKEILDFSILSQSTLVPRNDDELQIKSASITDIKTTSAKQGGTTIIVSGSSESTTPYWS